MNSFIEIYGAREHNLKNIDLKIPRDKLVVFTGVSGSGKSSLAFNTIFAEGQRRYVETLSSYAKRFVNIFERPDVDQINGLSPVIAIEQKTTNKNPRSTVGTITEIYDFLRLLYAHVSDAYSINTGEKMIKYTNEQILELIQSQFNQKKILILTPLIYYRKGNHQQIFESYLKKGFSKFRVNGKIIEANPNIILNRCEKHKIELVIDKIDISNKLTKEFKNSIELAMNLGKGVFAIMDYQTNKIHYFSKNLICPTTGISYLNPEPNTFSFNSPKGYCNICKGLGKIQKINLKKIIIDEKLSIFQAISVFNDPQFKNYFSSQVKQILKIKKYEIKTLFNKLDEETRKEILYGVKKNFQIKLESAQIIKNIHINFEGIIPYLESFSKNFNLNIDKSNIKKNYFSFNICPSCNGNRIKKESLQFKIREKNISEVCNLSLIQFDKWIKHIPNFLNKTKKNIAIEIIKEITRRLEFLLEIGLEYLTLNRNSQTLSGGELQRIRLATQIGVQLINVLYILDEPSIGLHQRDNLKLIKSLKKLRDIGNSILLVEHDKDIILESDYIFEIGPYSGKNGGEIIWSGMACEIKKANTLTSNYINGIKSIKIPEKIRKNKNKYLILNGCIGNNLKNITLKIPLEKLVGISGVSGSGKSSLINKTLYPILSQHFYRKEQNPLPYESIYGLEFLDKVVEVDQSSIGRTPRSNPATYTGVFTDIRNLFTHLVESKIRGYKAKRFSFNIKGGRCETCKGGGLKLIEMTFLPDIYVLCESCYGKRFNRETLEIRYKGKSISDILDMTIDDTVDFFSPIPKIYNKIKILQQIGLGYLSLGQQSNTLSGGEAQRVKLATELAKKQTGKTIYILDEPTTGLHFDDIRILMDIIQKIVDYGNTVIVIEHNLDVLKVCDHIIDMGPEGGEKGGEILDAGTPHEISTEPKGYTGKFLKIKMNL